jgi:hypothetical protein
MRRRVVSIAALAVLALGVVLVTVPEATSADGDPVRTFVLRTVEDPSIDPLPPGACPFAGGIILNLRAHTWSIATRASDGMVVQEQLRPVGTERACTQVTFPLVEGSTAPFYAQFELADGSYTANGSCRVTSNGIPQAGVVLAGCALRLQARPAGFVGGVAASASVLTLGTIPGFETGSFWTLRVYSST